MKGKKIQKKLNTKIDNYKETSTVVNNSITEYLSNITNSELEKNNKKEKSILINHFLELLLIVKVYHWKTHSYAEHKATDEYYKQLNENIDRFVEVMLGKKESRLNMKNKSIVFSDPSNKTEFIKLMNKYIELLQDKMSLYINISRNTDLLTIRDEILADSNQLLYLLTFNK